MQMHTTSSRAVIHYHRYHQCYYQHQLRIWHSIYKSSVELTTNRKALLLKGYMKCHKTSKSVISFWVPNTTIKSSSPVFSSFIFPWPSQNYGGTHKALSFFSVLLFSLILSFFPVLIYFFPLCFLRLIPTKPGLMKPTSVQQRCWAAVKCREVHFLLMLSSRAAPSCFYHGIYLLGLHTCTYQPHCKCCPV